MSETGAESIFQGLTGSEVDTGEQKNIFVDSQIAIMKEVQKKNGQPFTVLFTDIDNTFYRADRHEASQELAAAARQGNIPIAAVTGNDFLGVYDRIKKGELPHFQIIAPAVGTEIWVLQNDGKYLQDEQYRRMLQEQGYDRVRLAKVGEDLVVKLRGGSEDSHNEWQFDFQIPSNEADYRKGLSSNVQEFKMSFYSYASSVSDLAELKRTLEKSFIGQKVVVCEEIGYNSKLQQDDLNKKYCIDILPVTKAGAVNYVAKRTGAEISVVAGDSGNDSEMLTGAGDVSIIVGGAKPELTDTIDKTVAVGEKGRHFAREFDETGKITKLFYQERGEKLGPESILRAGRFLRLAQKIHAAKPESE